MLGLDLAAVRRSFDDSLEPITSRLDRIIELLERLSYPMLSSVEGNGDDLAVQPISGTVVRIPIRADGR